MMKTIGILSDTHRVLSPAAYAAMADCDHIIHAGDICDPDILDTLRTLAPVTAVLGNNDHPEYGENVGRFANVEIFGVRFLIAHYPRDVRIWEGPTSVFSEGDPVPDVCINGHTHRPYLKSGASVAPAKLHLCPGSVTRPRGDHPASVGKVQVEDGKIVHAWIETVVGGEVIVRMRKRK